MIVACTGDQPMDELTFVRAVKTCRSTRSPVECVGPLVVQDLTLDMAASMLDAFTGLPAAEQMWQVNHDPTAVDAMRYRLCTVHWIDLASLLRIRAREDGRVAWYRLGCNLLQGVCKVNGWDVKELSNMLISQRVQLT